MNRDVRAFLAGTAAFAVLYALYFAAVTQVSNNVIGAVLMGAAYVVPLVAGGITAYLAGQRQFAAVFALGIVGAGLVALINFGASSLGAPTDFPGLRSVPLVAALSLLVQLPLVLVGGAAVGVWLRSRHA